MNVEVRGSAWAITSDQQLVIAFGVDIRRPRSTNPHTVQTVKQPWRRPEAWNRLAVGPSDQSPSARRPLSRSKSLLQRFRARTHHCGGSARKRTEQQTAGQCRTRRVSVDALGSAVRPVQREKEKERESALELIREHTKRTLNLDRPDQHTDFGTARFVGEQCVFLSTELHRPSSLISNKRMTIDVKANLSEAAKEPRQCSVQFWIIHTSSEMPETNRRLRGYAHWPRPFCREQARGSNRWRKLQNSGLTGPFFRCVRTGVSAHWLGIQTTTLFSPASRFRSDLRNRRCWFYSSAHGHATKPKLVQQQKVFLNVFACHALRTYRSLSSKRL